VSRFNPATGAPMLASWVSHQISTMPIGGGVDQNGFRLQQNQAANQLFVGGYLSAPFGALPQLLTPYLMTLNPGLGFTAGKHFQSGNNAPLADYFEERGNSVYINTPDIISFNPSTTSMRNYIVSQNNVSGGFDLNITLPLGNSGCERPLTITTVTQPITVVGSSTFTGLGISPSIYTPSPATRPMSQAVLCQQFAMVASPDIWPNPASQEVKLALSDGETIESVTVYDLNGKIVLQAAAPERMRAEMTLDISALTNGVYLIHMTDANGIVHRDKFVKE
jgi:hypothetical protein